MTSEALASVVTVKYIHLASAERRAYHALAAKRWRERHPEKWREVQKRYRARLKQKK